MGETKANALLVLACFVLLVLLFVFSLRVQYLMDEEKKLEKLFGKFTEMVDNETTSWNCVENATEFLINPDWEDACCYKRGKFQMCLEPFYIRQWNITQLNATQCENTSKYSDKSITYCTMKERRWVWLEDWINLN